MNKVDRAAWLLERNLGIGGSECAAALGIDPYITQRELWERKLGRLPDTPDNERMAAGRHIEPAIAAWAIEKYGFHLRMRHQSLVHRNIKIMRANVDRVHVGQRRGVELKNVDRLIVQRSNEWGEEGSSQIPERHYLQVQHYMEVLNFEAFDVIACIGGNELRRYQIERDEELIEEIVEREQVFWGYVEREEPPPFDFDHASTLPLLKKLYPGTSGESIDLPPEAVHWHKVMTEAGKQVKRYEAIVDGCKGHLLGMLGDAAIGTLNDNSGEYRRKIVNRRGFEVAPTSYIDFRFKSTKGDANDE
ncbi:YqaJ viral recombinase family nuclease [Caballeronia zhejiangensis]|uniref:YqaJ viral recombinase family nuclease n=1 Tax=Caballeronia zhejiangensis TaxID=871203 RepID=UPI00158B2DF5|nr:YqaJ viral recombinase family protein [Caballeronia zhejiangensis]MCG7403047.1 YqaJ viral recombinase family protein [Caballeronia zhejiangensis]MCI1043872.1 YqaJ viral recombinase family protein [Caballeronia zhejiangensis]